MRLSSTDGWSPAAAAIRPASGYAAAGAQPHGDGIRCGESVAGDAYQRPQYVFGFLEVDVLEIQRVREQRGGKHPNLSGAVRLSGRAHDAAQVCSLGPFAGQLDAVPLRRRPLVAEDVRRRGLAVG